MSTNELDWSVSEESLKDRNLTLLGAWHMGYKMAQSDGGTKHFLAKIAELKAELAERTTERDGYKAKLHAEAMAHLVTTQERDEWRENAEGLTAKMEYAILADLKASVKAEAVRECAECWPDGPSYPTTTGNVRAALLKLAKSMAAQGDENG